MGGQDMTDYTKLVKALRRCAEPGTIIDECDTCDDCPYSLDGYCGDCMNNLVKDAAAAIEALQAQLPKRGKWVGVNPMVDSVQCSVCGGQLFSAELETPYCPYCGAKMNNSNASNASNALNALDNAHDGLIVETESPSPKPTDPVPIRDVYYVMTECDVKTGTVTYELRERSET